MINKKALVIFSGGQDSTTCLGWSLNRYEIVECISFLYGQKHSIEIEQSKKIINEFEKRINRQIKHHIIDISFFGQIVDSALTNNGNVNEKHSRIEGVPASFVPNRNAMFITIAHSLAQKIGADKLITGVCETDFSGYNDCRYDFIKSIEYSLNIGTWGIENTAIEGIKIETPLMYLNKSQIFKMSEEENCLDIVVKMSHTCYNGSTILNEWGYGCNECPACKLRRKGFEEFKLNYKGE